MDRLRLRLLTHTPALVLMTFLTGIPVLGAFARPPEFHEITPRLYRGGRPTEADLRALRDTGTTTVVDLENVPEAIDAEKAIAERLGLRFVSIPLEAKAIPAEADVTGVLALLSAPTSGKVFLHCLHGQERTGLIAALYRVEAEGWDPDDAYREMMANGFHVRYARPLEAYFRVRTGYFFSPTRLRARPASEVN